MLKPRGLIVVTGPTGSGKSTTLAAMIDYLNNTTPSRVITIEDPIEYIYKDNKCVISQRELGSDTVSFATALKHALRHDPDVIVVGEMRDLETMSTAIAAAETGHLVLGTLHTIDAPQTVDRMIDMFPPQQHQQVRLRFRRFWWRGGSDAYLPRLPGKGGWALRDNAGNISREQSYPGRENLRASQYYADEQEHGDANTRPGSGLSG
jgi:twitching motility protein PilT